MKALASFVFRSSCMVVAWFMVQAVSSGASAAVLIVANNGVDSATCGSKLDPCRSLSQTIANANNGDKIIVGPGRYGDLNGDGVFDQPGEETAQIGMGCYCMVHLFKAVTIYSRDGAAATVLHAGGADVDVVRVGADGATFGRRRGGFTITGSARVSGLGIPVGTSGVTVEGNLSAGNSGSGFQILGSDHVIRQNAAIANGGSGFSTGNAEGVRFDGNVSIANRGGGFQIASAGDRDHIVMRNAATGNDDYGFFLRGFDYSVRLNVANGNGDDGFIADSSSGSNNHDFSLNSAVGNAFHGIDLVTPIGTGAMTRSSLFGNFFGNCGLNGDSVDASRSFWGAADGPGADPADDVCGAAVTVDPFLRKEKRIRPRWPSL